MFSEHVPKFEGGAFTPRRQGAQPKILVKINKRRRSMMYGTVRLASLRQMNSANIFGESRYATGTLDQGAPDWSSLGRAPSLPA